MPEATSLVTCRLTSGRTVETTFHVCQSLGGTLVTLVAADASQEASNLVLCRLPGGEGDVAMTRDSCIANGGEIIGKP